MAVTDSATRAPAPSVADGVDLIGEYEGSGYKEPPSLVQRSDGQVIQLPPLLYAIAVRCDGQHDVSRIAAEVGSEIRREIDPEQVQYLIDEKLRPLGILTLADGSSPQLEKPDPFLALRFRVGVISERWSDRLGTAFKPLFLPLIVLGALAAFVAVDVWLFFVHGVAQSLRQALYHPGLFLPLFVAVVLSAAFHEIGHAAACRYGGGHPGRMGCGIYLAWPAFYTDVTDAYRLGRRARLRTDLGGVYFNVIFVLATAATYFATGFEPLLLLIVIQHFEIAHQLLPIVRLDGYYIVADLTGVPDLFARIGPILGSLVPGRPSDERVTVLKRWVRVAVTAWVLIVVPLLLFEAFVVLLHLPRIVGTAWDSGHEQFDAARIAFTSGQTLEGVTAALQVVVLAIPVLGIILMLLKLATSGARSGWSRTDGRPVLRAAFVLVSAVAVGLLLFTWLPGDNYEPIHPGERGTIGEASRAVIRIPHGDAPLYSERQAQKRDAQNGNAPATVDAPTPSTTAVTDAGSSGVSPDASSSSSGATTSTTENSTTSTSTSTTSSTTTTSTTSTTSPSTTTTSTTIGP
ncbi:MAG TPA: hypothetical protein VFV00_09550 [Acidimicrobiales bacterium]|nr:hypothetical protein [Acidimicrobiales bacterium]